MSRPDEAAEVTDAQQLRVIAGSVERRGTWTVPRRLEIRVVCGHLELDLREATLGAGTTTFEVAVTAGSLEILVPPHISVEVEVTSVASNVSETRPRPVDRSGQVVRIVGVVKLGNCEILTLYPGESPTETERCAHRARRREQHHEPHAHHQARHERRRARREHRHAERELWMRGRHDHHRWQPWWLMARMRRRIFSWFAIVFAAGIAVGVYGWGRAPWWHIALAVLALSFLSGAVAWRLTRPLILVVRAARDIGDGKLDTRIDPRAHGGEVRLLAAAINDMASKIQQQLADQRQLLAAVSHELRTPLGHMRVLIETARDQNDPKALAELETEVLVLDDLVGRLLASSRLEFGTVERRELDLGELVSDIATSAGIAPEAIEAIGEVRAPIDPTLIRRAVANLLDNARVHGQGAIAIRIERRAGQVAIEVDDAGPGVRADRRADAFRAFVPSSAGGLGLGLALVSRIAVAHGGGAWITDRPGGGARVGFAVAAG